MVTSEQNNQYNQVIWSVILFLQYNYIIFRIKVTYDKYFHKLTVKSITGPFQTYCLPFHSKFFLLKQSGQSTQVISPNSLVI